MNNNIITAVFGAMRETKVRPRYRYDRGQVLVVRGVKNLPDFYEVHFANEGSTADATPLIGTPEGVEIPATYFQSGATIYAYIYVHDEATDGTTVYKVTIPIINRARPADVEPTPEQEDIIAQAIVALNTGVEAAEDAAQAAQEAARNVPQIIDAALQEAKDSGEFDGPKGDKGDLGAQGPAGGNITVEETLISGEDYELDLDDNGEDLAGEIAELKSDIVQNTRNLADLNTQLVIGKAWNGGTNAKRAIVNVPITPATQYTVSFDSTGFDAVTIFEKANAADTTTLYSTGISSPYTRTSHASANCLCVQFNKSTDITAADFANTNLQVEYGSQATPYIAPQSAKDIIVRDGAITYVTPEMFGAWGDGVHNDTAALQSALDSGKNVIANGKYKITATLLMRPTYKVGQKFEFNQIICTGNTTALRLDGRNGYVNGFYIESLGNCVSFGQGEVTYNWDTHFSILESTNGICVRMGGGGNVSECIVKGERFHYKTSGVYFDLSAGFVGQVTFMGMTIGNTYEEGNYAFMANGAQYPMTGLTCFNVSLEGAGGGFNFVNSQNSTPISPLYCFGLRTSELTVVHGFKLLRLTGNGIIAGDIFGDIITLDSIDVSLHNPDITLEQSLNFHGRIAGYGRGWRGVRIVGKNVVPEFNKEYMSNVSNPVYTDQNLPYSSNLISGAGSWTVDFPFDGLVTFISSADGTTMDINGTSVTLNNTQTLTVETVCSQSDVKLLIHRPNGTTVPKTLT